MMVGSHAIVKNNSWGTWVAHLVNCPTIDFGSGHDLMVFEIEPHTWLCADSADPAWDSFSLCPSPAHTCVHSCALSLSQNK